jgi:hypothetical protein
MDGIHGAVWLRLSGADSVLAGAGLTEGARAQHRGDIMGVQGKRRHLAEGEVVDTIDERIAETANLIEVYHANAEWIRFADAKAAVALTANGALGSVFIQALRPFVDGLGTEGGLPAWIAAAALCCFAAWLVCAGLSATWAFDCIHPFRAPKRELDACRHFHPEGIVRHYGPSDLQRFRTDIDQAGVEGFREQVLACLLMDAGVSSRKYARVARSIRFFMLSALFGFAYLALAQL